MSAEEQAGVQEKSQAEQLILSLPALPEVEDFQVRLSDDWIGDPSLYITFRLRSGTLVDDAFLGRFNRYRLSVSKAILDTDISRFPYTDFEKAA